MVSKLAGAALVLIIAVPILLGYGLAFEEEDYVSYETSDRINVTDRVLNSTNPIFMASTSPLNNSELLARITYPGSGVTETSIKAPAYASTGSKYTPIPLYQTVTGYYNLNASTTYTTSGDNLGSYSQINIPANVASTRPYLYITTDQLAQLSPSSGAGKMDYTFGPFVQSGEQTWQFSTYNDQSNPKNTGTFRILSDRFPTYTVTYVPYTDFDVSANYTFTLTGAAAIKITHSDNSTEYYPMLTTPTGGIQIIKQGTNLTIGESRYDNVKLVSVAAAPSVSQIYYSYTETVASTYADPSYGWTTNVANGNPARIYWMNSQLNGSIRMLAEIQTGESLDIQPMNGDIGTSFVPIRKPTSGNGLVTVNGNSLGNYTYLCLDITGSSVTVSGIDSWPNMYTAPNIINSITVDLENPIELFDRVWLSGSTSINYRVDSAEILSGYFATTLDATIDMATLWPDKSFVLSMSSIGIYGDSITYAGQIFPVSNGSITVNGKSIRLLQAAFSATLEDGEYTATINGEEVATSATAPALYLGGEWSLALMAYNVERIEGTRMVWHAGEFAFNGADSSFALLGLLTCGAVFVGLGMYGRRSGAKVGMLMMITGCAALIFLAMI